LSLYPPSVWNVSLVKNGEIARTNNPLERFNRELNTAFSTAHPSLGRFVQTIEEVSRKYVTLRNDITNGRAKAPARGARAEIPVPEVLPETDNEDISDEEVEYEGSGDDYDGLGLVDSDSDSPDEDEVDEYNDYITFSV
jgi:hypothetical protein